MKRQEREDLSIIAFDMGFFPYLILFILTVIKTEYELTLTSNIRNRILRVN